MKYYVEEVYLTEIIFQCEQGLDAVHRAQVFLNKNEAPRHVMSFLDDVIDHASRASLLLWPVPGQETKNKQKQEANQRRASRGDHLRSVLELDDEHPIKSRKLRDNLHHFDERLDTITSKTPLVFIDGELGPRILVEVDGAVASTMRHFDYNTSTYYFQEVEFNIAEVVRGLADVRERCLARLASLKEKPRAG
ncbi:hypothetical protein [Methylorubrum thiocyanatum]